MSTAPVVLLLGAGFSKAAGMKDTSEITEQALSLNWRSVDGVASSEKLDESYEELWRQQRLLIFLDRAVRRYYRRIGRAIDPNYEDLAYVAGQIEDVLRGEFDNPAVVPLINAVKCRLQATLLRSKQSGTINHPLGYLAGSARHMIYDLTWKSLTMKPDRLDGIGFVTDMVNDSDACDIFTLNHDLVLEFLLQKHEIKFSDGFGSYNDTGPRPWSPEGPDSVTTRLYKLHGAVNWVRFTGRLYGVPASQIANTEFANVRGPDDQEPDRPRPEILVGTFDKVLRYTERYFVEMQCRLMRALYKTTSIIVCGYSFGDQGVNAQLMNWLKSTANSRRMLVIDPKPEDLKDNARGAIRKHWDQWEDERKLNIIASGAEGVTWEQIKTSL